MIKKLIVPLLVLTFFSPPVYPQDNPSVIPLNVLIDEAKKNNPEILAAAKRYAAAQARVPQAKSPDDPAVEFRFEKMEKNPFNLSAAPAMERMFSLSRILPWFGKLSLKGKMALIESQILAAEYKDKELAVVNEVKNTYYELFMNCKEEQFSEESLAFLKNIACVAEAGYAVGDIMQEDLFKINLEMAKLGNDITNLRQKRGALKTRLNTLLNRQAEAAVDMPWMEEDVTFTQDTDYLYRMTIENQPALLVFSYVIERNKYAKDLAGKSFFPDLMAGIVMRGLTAGSIGPWDLMLALSVPVWFWTKQRYAVKEAIANVEEAQAAYQAMKNKAIAETKELAANIEIAGGRAGLYRNTQIPLLEASIRSSQAAYGSGKGNIMMLLDNERMLIQTKTEYYKSLVEYNMNLADLERAVGIALAQE